MSSRFVLLLTALNGVMLLGAWAGPTSAPNPSPRVLRAQLIELVDAQGNVRGQLHLGDDGSGQLRLRSATGNVAVKLGPTQEGGAGLLLMDPTVEPGIVLTAKRAGPSITLRQGAQTRVLTP